MVEVLVIVAILGILYLEVIEILDKGQAPRNRASARSQFFGRGLRGHRPERSPE